LALPRARALCAALAPGRLAPVGSESGDTLIEVVISAALISLVVIAVLFGLDSTNQATASSRARSQADALAQQDEERLRSEPIKKIGELERKETVTIGATTYTITTTAKYHSNVTGTASCSSSVPTADYLQTVSTVTWPSGPSGGVVETGVISPPADSALIVRVEDAGTPLGGAKVMASGPAPSVSEQELETSLNGCVILALSPGEYTINVSKAGYVDENGYPNTEKDPNVTKKVYLPAETTAKEGYHLGLAGKLKVTFTEAGKTVSGDSFVYFNTGMAHYETYPSPETLETYGETLEANDIYPPSTGTEYSVYAGNCEADLPSRNGQITQHVPVAPGETVPITVALGPIDIKVLESKTVPTPVNNATVVLEDTGCKAVRKLATTPEGTLNRPGMPFGTYSLCVTATVGGKHREVTVPIENDNATGTPLQTIYLAEGKEGSVC
jgi:Tfp pilus assembly protein PilV